MKKSLGLMGLSATLMVGALGLGLGSGVGCGSQDDDDDDFNYATPAPSAVNQASNAGDYALDFLTSADYDKIYVEIDYMSDGETDYGPEPKAIDFLLFHLDLFCDKTDIIYNPEDSDVIPIQTQDDGTLKTDYTYAELNGLELAYRDNYRGGDTAVLYYLYVNGRYVLDSGEATSAIGFAHHGSSMVILKGIVNNALPAARTFYEKTVIVHESGHLLGLVDIGVDPVNPNHVDPDPRAAGAHCVFENCMMHWAVGPDDLLNSFLSGEEQEFDQCCRDDIAAAGGNATVATGASVCEPPSEKGHPAPSPKASHALDPYHPNILF